MARMTSGGDLSHRRASVPDLGNACGGLVMAVLLAALPLAVGACALGSEAGYTAQMRNDASTTYLVDYKSDQVVWVFRVPGHSTVEFYSASGVHSSYWAEATIYLTDCTKVATVQLTKDLDTIYVDPQGHASVRAFRDVPYSGPVGAGGLGSYEPGCPK